MKKIIALAMFIVLTSLTFGQNSRVIVKDLGTVANSVDETGYVTFPNWKRIDSVSVSIAASGELDIDSLTLYKAVFADGVAYTDVTVLGNFTVTLNLADGVKDIEQLYSSNATLLTGDALRGVNAVKYLTRGATSGNDATDTGQRAFIVFQFWGNDD